MVTHVRTRWRSSFRAVSLLSLALAAGTGRAADAGRGERTQDREDDAGKAPAKGGKSRQEVVRITGKLGKAVKGSEDSFELTFQRKDEKGKPRAVKAIVSIPKEATLRIDVPLTVKQVPAGKSAAVFGKPVALDAVGPNNVVVPGGDLQIQNAQAMLLGDAADFALELDRTIEKLPGLKWCTGKAAASKGGLQMEYQGGMHRVLLAKAARILERTRLDRKKLRSGSLIEVVAVAEADSAAEPAPSKRPSGGKDEDAGKDQGAKKTAKGKDGGGSAKAGETDKSRKTGEARESYVAKGVIVLDPASLKSIYPLLRQEE